MVLGACGGSAPAPMQSSSAQSQAASDPGDVWRKFYGITNPPDVQVVRSIAPEDVDGVLSDCLAEAGYAPMADGGYDVPTSMKPAFNLAQYTCRMKYPIIDKYSGAWGEEQIRRQYNWTTGFLLGCLAEHGHPVSSAVPSESKFIETWVTAPFYPFSELGAAGVPSAELNALERDCPQIAPSSIVWDGESISQWRQRTGR